MEERFIAQMIHCFFIAFGIIVGGAIIGSIGAFATGDAPFTQINRIADRLRIWAIVAAIGGTFDTIANFEKGLLDGSTYDLFKQIMLILTAMGGVKAGLVILSWLIQEDLG